jgi:hypothetical protein
MLVAAGMAGRFNKDRLMAVVRGFVTVGTACIELESDVETAVDAEKETVDGWNHE